MSCWMGLLFSSELGPAQGCNATVLFCFVFSPTLIMVEIVSIALAFSFSQKLIRSLSGCDDFLAIEGITVSVGFK